ncbi:rod-binding protein [Phenylobacterium sp. J367]|uniref:rod-binding protein n=1 Tax=Phenylobacterium sp. J367 TaxID=2898435 RepID=UPI002150FEB8|nr:rod-binding protein [Phenylobacterium sp. J367]MCR5879932.1 rod-binding protein [Phenylobacterium sp. J367]
MTPVSVAPTLLQPGAGAASAAELAKRGEIRETAQKFETQFLSIMLQQMFEGVNVSAPFGGGPGEQMFKSFMTEAMAKQMSQAGGLGLTDQIQREMLKLQGLS